MINELIEQIGGRERLEEMSQCSDVTKLFAYEMRHMARALLAVLGQGCLHQWISSEGRTDSGWLCSKCGDYDGPPAASVPDVNFDPAKSGAEATIVTHFVAPEGCKLVPIEPYK